MKAVLQHAPGPLPPAVAPDIHELTALDAVARSLRLRPPFRALAEQTGPHQSRFRGRGLEFVDLREYQIGDDLRDIDWRSTARTGTPHIRCYQAERERLIWLLIDQRTPMQFGTQRCFKSVAAARVAALLGWAAVHAGDRVGGLVLTDNHCEEIRPRRSRASLLRLFGKLCERESAPTEALPDADGPMLTLSHALQRSATLLRPGALVFLISDLHDLDESAAPACQKIQRHSDLITIRITDILEHQLPPPGWYTYAVPQGRRRVHTGDANVRRQFQARVESRETALAGMLRDLRLANIFMRTADQPLEVLHHGLGARRA